MAAEELISIECVVQPLSIAFHPRRNLVVAGLVDGSVALHDYTSLLELRKQKEEEMGRVTKLTWGEDSDEDDDDESIKSSTSGGCDDGSNGVMDDDKIDGGGTSGKKDDGGEGECDGMEEADGDDCGDEDDLEKLREWVDRTRIGSLPLHKKSCRSVALSIDGGGSDDMGGTERGGAESESSLLFSVGADSSLCCVDLERMTTTVTDETTTVGSSPPSAVLWTITNAHPKASSINKIYVLPSSSSANGGGDGNDTKRNLLATGDDDGVVRLWDIRLCGNDNQKEGDSCDGSFDLPSYPRGCVAEWTCHEDYISDFATDDSGNLLLASSGDCRLSVMDVRKGMRYHTHHRLKPQRAKKKKQKKKRKGSQEEDADGADVEQDRTPSNAQMGIVGLSDYGEDELLSVRLIKGGRKVVCGTVQGKITVWSWGEWTEDSDRIRGHADSVDCILPLDDDTVLTGCADGLIRVVQIHPNQMLGVLGRVGSNARSGGVSEMKFGAGRKVIGSTSNDETLIRLWDASVLIDDDDDDDDEEEAEEDGREKQNQEVEQKEKDMQPAGGTTKIAWGQKSGSLDDLEDEGSDKDSDDSDSDGESSCGGRGGRKKLKTENERFFEGL